MKNDNVKFKISKIQKYLLLVVMFFAIVCFCIVVFNKKSKKTRKDYFLESPENTECQSLCSKITSPDDAPAISSSELEGGMYYGSLAEKKIGTPNNWVHALEGTRGSLWRSPEVRKNYECDCYKNQNKVENIDINIETSNKDKVDDSRAALIKAAQYLKDGNTEEAIKYFTLTPTKNESLIRSFTKEQRNNLANWLENAEAMPTESNDDYRIYRYYYGADRTNYMEFGMGKDEDGNWIISNW